MVYWLNIDEWSPKMDISDIMEAKGSPWDAMGNMPSLEDAGPPWRVHGRIRFVDLPMVIVLTGATCWWDPFQMAYSWLINRGDPNHFEQFRN